MSEYSPIIGYDIDKSKVRIVEIIKIDEKILGRLDMVCMAYYGDITYMPLLFDWNSITDVSDLKIGDTIMIPSLDDILNQCNDENVENTLMQDDFDKFADVPGIVDNKATISPGNKNITISKSRITANKKLNIETRPAEYNPKTGEITYY